MTKNVIAMMNHVAAHVANNMSLIENLKQYAKENHVPIIMDAGLSFLLENIKKYQVKTILEIGTAIGYSAINMALAGANVVTIERDEKMYQEALKNIKEAGLEDKIKVLFIDAKEAFLLVENMEFDMLFIDAAKASYQKFFDLYIPLLKKNGIVICDNLAFHGLAEKNANLDNCSRNLRAMIRKLNNFKDYLKSNENFSTNFFEIGDGMSVSIKKS